MTYRVVCTYLLGDSDEDADLKERHEHLVRRSFGTLDKAQRYVESVASSRSPKIFLEVSDDHTALPVEERVDRLQEELERILLPWESDNHVPNNLLRKTGMGVVICEVNRWCGTFQDPHKPTVVGYRVSGRSPGVLLVSEYDNLGDCIADAKGICDSMLKQLKGKYEE